MPCSAIRRGVYRSGTASLVNASPSLSTETMRSVFPAIATIPSGQCSDVNEHPDSSGW